MEITIALDKIQNGIMQLTAILGRNRQDMNLAVTQDTLPAIGIYIGEAVTEADNELRRHIKDSSIMSLYRHGEAVVLNIKDKIRMSPSIFNQVGSSFELYIIHYTIARWLSTISSVADLAESYSNSSAGYISKLAALVCQKDEYKLAEDEYKQRSKDTHSIEGNSYYKKKYCLRQRDLQPTGKSNGAWPKEIITTTDPGVATDSKGNILVSQPNYKET